MAFQVAKAKVLIPTTGLLPAEAINAATDLRLIVNPAAGKERLLVKHALHVDKNLHKLNCTYCMSTTRAQATLSFIGKQGTTT